MNDPKPKTEVSDLLVTMTRDDLRVLIRQEIEASRGEHPTQRWIDVETAAKHAGVSTKTIRRWIADGLAATHFGRDYRLRLEDLDAWFESHRTTRKAG